MASDPGPLDDAGTSTPEASDGRGPSPEPRDASAATCGNGTREPGEACDDGNVIDGDPCSADCRTASQPRFMTRQGSALSLGGKPLLTVGVNKFDLFHQFLGIASGGAGLSVTRPQALAALDDAARAGITVMRLAAQPYWPNEMKAWQLEPARYWAAFDDMVNQAHARGIRLVPCIMWNPFVFPDIVGEPLGRIFENGSASSDVLFRYARELAARYRNNETILAWELTNELNLQADLDMGVRNTGFVCTACGTPAARTRADDFATDKMVALLVDLGRAVKERDPNHLVSSGYATPRLNAWHLRSRPEWSGADWTVDSAAEMASYVAVTHPDPIDLVSIHPYNDHGDNERYGVEGRFNPDNLRDYQAAATAIAKPLFVGEFADTEAYFSEGREARFTRRMLLRMYELRIPLSAFWAWEFHQFAPSTPTASSIQPGVDDELIGMFTEVNDWMRSAPVAPAKDVAVRNADFEQDDNANSLPDGWEQSWRNGASTDYHARAYVSASEAFMGSRTLRLYNGSNDAASFVFAHSDPVAVQGSDVLLVSAALRWGFTSDAGAKVHFTVLQYDGSGKETSITERTFTKDGGWRWRVFGQRVALRPDTTSIRIRFGIGGMSDRYLDVDDARVTASPP